MQTTVFNQMSEEELLQIEGGGFWSQVAYYSFVGGVSALGGAIGFAAGGPVGGVLGARVGQVLGAGAGAYLGDQIWAVTR